MSVYFEAVVKFLREKDVGRVITKTQATHTAAASAGLLRLKFQAVKNK